MILFKRCKKLFFFIKTRFGLQKLFPKRSLEIGGGGGSTYNQGGLIFGPIRQLPLRIQSIKKVLTDNVCFMYHFSGAHMY